MRTVGGGSHRKPMNSTTPSRGSRAMCALSLRALSDAAELARPLGLGLRVGPHLAHALALALLLALRADAHDVAREAKALEPDDEDARRVELPPAQAVVGRPREGV